MGSGFCRFVSWTTAFIHSSSLVFPYLQCNATPRLTVTLRIGKVFTFYEWDLDPPFSAVNKRIVHKVFRQGI